MAKTTKKPQIVLNKEFKGAHRRARQVETLLFNDDLRQSRTSMFKDDLRQVETLLFKDDLRQSRTSVFYLLEPL